MNPSAVSSFSLYFGSQVRWIVRPLSRMPEAEGRDISTTDCAAGGK